MRTSIRAAFLAALAAFVLTVAGPGANPALAQAGGLGSAISGGSGGSGEETSTEGGDVSDPGAGEEAGASIQSRETPAGDALPPGAPEAVTADSVDDVSQTPITPRNIDYAEWERRAASAEQSIDAGRASDQALASLRADLVEWRDIFDVARTASTVRINTLQTQLDALGPAPADGASEAEGAAEERSRLSAALEEARAPVQQAELAYTRADTLVTALDALVRDRQTERLFRIGPSPLNPANWATMIDEVGATLARSYGGTVDQVGAGFHTDQLTSFLPVIVIFAVVGLFLLILGQRWVLAISSEARLKATGPRRGVISFVLSLGRIIAPFVGLVLLVQAAVLSGLLGLTAQVIVELIPLVGLNLFIARWFGNRMFGDPGDTMAVLNLPDNVRLEGRFDTVTLGFLMGIAIAINEIGQYESYSRATLAILHFPVLAFSGFLLLRLGQLVRRHVRAEEMSGGDADDEEDNGLGFLNRTLQIGGQLMIVIGALGPLLALIGYRELSTGMVYQTVQTVALIALLMVLHRLNTDVFGMVAKRDSDEAGQSLIPVVATMLELIALVPVFALVWGARVTDLTEMWIRIQSGISFGDTVITPGIIITFAIVLGLGLAATRLVQGMLKTTILPKTGIDVGGRHAITSGVGYIGIFLAAVIAITAAGIDLSSLAIVAGALSVGIGFGLQTIVSNFVSGIILLIERPISEGDWIEVNGRMGHVRDISVRSTRIETFDRTDVILPNSDLISGVVTNYTRGNRVGRLVTHVGVAYGTDTRRVEEILLEIAGNHPVVALNPEPQVTFQGFGADALEFEIRVILRDVNYILIVKGELHHQIAERFREEGIEIPFAQRDIWLRNPETLWEGYARAEDRATPPKAATSPAKDEEGAAEPLPSRKAARAGLDEEDMENDAEDGTGDTGEDGND